LKTKAKVAIQKCGSYDPKEVFTAVSKVFTDAGGFDIIKPGQRVLLKLNLLNAAPVERAVTTHPEITRALIRLVKNAGGAPVAGDAPGLDLPGMGRKVLKTSGTLAVCQQEDISAVVFTDKGYEVVTLESNVKLKSIHIAREILEADVIIGVSKAKSHLQAYYTGGIKNFFGTCPGKDKKIAHTFPNTEEFSQSLVDIFAACNPDFGIMDGIIGMEGRGPSGGKPRFLGLVLGSKDFVALDRVTSTAMGYDRIDIPHIRQAAKRNLGEGELENIEIIGPPIDKVRQIFELPPTSKIPVPGFLNKVIFRLWQVDPKVTHLCVKCGHCATVCPVDAIVMGDEIALIDYKDCINCFCCHELCPNNAILEKTSLFVKVFRFVSWVKKRLLPESAS